MMFVCESLSVGVFRMRFLDSAVITGVSMLVRGSGVSLKMRCTDFSSASGAMVKLFQLSPTPFSP